MTTPRRTFTPVTFGPLRLRNRTVRAAAFEGMSPGGAPAPSLEAYHRSVAAGGVGMTTVAYAAVTRDGLTFGHQLWMRPEIVPALRALTDAVHAEGAAASLQLGHGGNMGDARVGGRRPLAPSRVFNTYGLTMPEAMSPGQIDEMAAAFGRATLLAREAGFDAVEVHAGHGYLVSQFLSPHTNRRTDAWGGPLPRRAHFMRQVMRAVRKAAPPGLAVVVKTNLSDGFAGGMTNEEGIAVARILEDEGADALVLSGGFVSKTPFYMMRGDVPVGEILKREGSLVNKVGLALFGRLLVKEYPFSEAFFLEEALAVRAAVKVPLVLLGGLRSLETMEDALGRGFAAVALARPLIIEPDFVRRLERGECTRSRCVPCNQCVATMYKGEMVCLPLVEGREPRTRG